MIAINPNMEEVMEGETISVDAWMVQDECGMTYGVYELDWMARAVAQGAADEDGEPVAVVPLYRAMLTVDERAAMEKAITCAQLAGHIDFPLVLRWLLERTE